MPGKITMSDKPRIGRTDGTALAADRSNLVSPLSGAAPKIRINSVSGAAIVGHFDIRCPGPLKSSPDLLLFRNENGFRLAARRRLGHLHVQKTILIRRSRLPQIISRWDFN